MKSRIIFTALAAVALVAPVHAGSTVNPNVPALKDKLNSPPIQTNFQAAYNDINNLLGKYASAVAPTNPTNFQEWADLSTSPVAVFKYWNAGTATWLPYASVNILTGVYTPFATSSSFLASAPITVSVSGGIATIGLSADSNFQVISNKLALASGAAGSLMCNSGSVSAEISICSWTAFADRAISSNNGAIPSRVGGAWGSVTTGTSGHVIPFLDGANTFSQPQAIYPGASALPATQNGSLFRAAQLDGVISRLELDSFGASSHFSGIRAGGTAAAKTAIVSADEISGYNAFGYNGTAYVGPNASIRMYAAQNWSVGANGTRVGFGTTTNGSTTLQDRLGVENDGGLTVPPTVSGGSQGAGTLNLGGNVFINGSPYNFSNLAGSSACSQLPALTGNITTLAGSCNTIIPTAAVTNAMLAGGVAASKLIGTDIATVGNLTAGSTGSGFSINFGASTLLGIVSPANGGTGIAALGAGVASALGGPAGGSGGFALDSQLASFLALSGGTMSGNIAMGSNNLSGVGTITAATYIGLPNATNATKGTMAGDGSTISCTAGVCSAVSSAATSILDQSTAVADPSKFWNPTYFGNTGTGVVSKANRLLLGVEALQGSQIPQSPQSWVNTLFGQQIMSVATLAVTNPLGQLAIASASRTSDYRTWEGGASGGSQGLTGIALNDDTGSGNPIACGVCGIAVRNSGVTGITLNQFDVNNSGSVVDVTPSGGVAGGSTFAIGLTPGSYTATAINNASAAMYIGSGISTTKFRKGIEIFADSLDTSVGTAGGGVAFEMGDKQELRWVNSGNATISEIFSTNSTGSMTLVAPSNIFLNSVVNLVQNPGATGAFTSVIKNPHATAGDYALIIENGASSSTADTTSQFITFADNSGTTVGSVKRNGGGSTIYATSSDERLKVAVRESSWGLSALRQVQVRDYYRKESPARLIENGVFAQELAKVYPFAVSAPAPEYANDPIHHPWIVDYGRLTPMIIRSTQELDNEVEDLRSRVSHIESMFGTGKSPTQSTTGNFIPVRSLLD